MAKQKERLGKNRFTLQIAHWAWIDDDAKVDISLANTFHHPLLRTIVQDKLNIWIAAMAFSNALRNKMRGNGLAGSDPNFSAQLLPHTPGIAQRAVQFIQQSLKTQSQLLPCICKHHFTRGSVQQANTSMIFQLLHTVTYCRLTQADTLSCTTKTFLLRYCDENL